jgi:hypothetical protein
MTDNLTGVWDGTYVQSQIGIVTFLATLIDSGGALGGNVTEPCILPSCLVGGTHNASIVGHRSGSAVSFIKRYEPSGCGYDTVFYEGVVNADATEIDGALEAARAVWNISDGSLNQACTIDRNRRADQRAGALASSPGERSDIRCSSRPA